MTRRSYIATFRAAPPWKLHLDRRAFTRTTHQTLPWLAQDWLHCAPVGSGQENTCSTAGSAPTSLSDKIFESGPVQPGGATPSSGPVQPGKSHGHQTPATKAKWLPILAAGCAYLALGFLATWQAWSQGVSHTGTGTAFDPVLFYWSLGYFAHFLGEPSRWFTTTVLARPGGVNLLDNTSIPLLGALFAPITLLWGPVASANVLTVLEIASAGFTVFLLARTWTGNALAGFCAGIIEIVAGNFGASAAFGHLMTLAFFVPPLLLLMSYKTLGQQRGNPWILGTLFGFLLAIQFFISTEIFADEVLLTGISLVACLALFWRQSLIVAKRAAKFLLAAMASSLVILAWPIWEALEGPWHVTGPAHPKLVGVGIRLPLVVMPNFTKDDVFCLLDGLHHCSPSMSPGGLGIPLIAAGLVSMVITWHKPIARFASVMTLMSFLLAMGSHPILHSHGKALAQVPLPFVVLARLPVLENLGPARLMKFVVLFLATVIAFGIDELAHWKSKGNASPNSARPYRRLADSMAPWKSKGKASPNRWLGLGAAAISLAVLLPIAPRWPYRQTSVSCPRFFTTKDVDIIAPGSVAVTYPFPSDAALALPWSQAMLWQACSNFRFSLVGGYVLEPGDSRRGILRITSTKGGPTFFPESHTLLARTLVPPGLPGAPSSTKLPPSLEQVLNKGPKSTQILNRIAKELRKWRVDVVLINPKFPRSRSISKLFSTLLREPPTVRGGIEYWIGIRKVLG